MLSHGESNDVSVRAEIAHKIENDGMPEELAHRAAGMIDSMSRLAPIPTLNKITLGPENYFTTGIFDSKSRSIAFFQSDTSTDNEPELDTLMDDKSVRIRRDLDHARGEYAKDKTDENFKRIRGLEEERLSNFNNKMENSPREAKATANVKNIEQLMPDPLSHTISHEWGHAWHSDNAHIVAANLGERFAFTGGNQKKPLHSDDEKYAVSDYSKSSSHECFSENFSCYFAGLTNRMHPDMVKFFDKQFPKLNFGRTYTAHRDSDVQR
jgi:hypothetical protein